MKEDKRSRSEQEESVIIDEGYSLSLAEPYYDEEGSPAVALIWNAQHLQMRSIADWEKEHPSLGEVLRKTFFPRKGQRWKYPSTPLLPDNYEDVRKLHIDIQRCNDHYIEFPNSAWPSAFATWLMGSYLVPFMDRSPILPIYAPTTSGKGQVLDQVDRLAYRGKKYINPTPAILFRQADRWQMTFALDEIQDKDKEQFQEIMSIVKGSYDGTPVPRFNINTGEVEEFRTRAFFAISFKDKRPGEDVVNRGIQLKMQMNGAHKELVPEDSDEHMEIRSRLMGLRLKALTDLGFIRDVLSRVKEIGTPEALGFDRRPRDKALALLIPAVMSNQEEEIIEIIKKSSKVADNDLKSTFIARVQRIYEKVLEIDEAMCRKELRKSRRFVYIKDDIIPLLEQELKEEGEIKEKDTLPSRRVTVALMTLGYEIDYKTDNKSCIDRDKKENKIAFEVNKKKFHIDEETGL